MTKEIEHLWAPPIFVPSEIKTRATAIQEAEKYCTNSPEKHFNSKHTYWNYPTNWPTIPAMIFSGFGAMTSPLFFYGGAITPTIFLGLGFISWFLSIQVWRKHKPIMLTQFTEQWQKQHEVTTNKLGMAAKNLIAISEFFNKQIERFNKYQRFIESGAVTLDEAQAVDRKKMCDKLNTVGDNLTKRINQLDYLLDIETKPSLDQEVVAMIELLGQTEIGNEIAKLLDPRFRTLTEVELETKALALLEELPQRI